MTQVTIFNRLLLAKIETTIGTDSVPVVATNAVRFKSAKLSVPTVSIQRPVGKQTMGELAPLIGIQTLQLDLEIELKSSGAAGTPPEISPILQCCSINETIVAATSVTYDPLSVGGKTCTLYWYEDGLLWKFLGTMGKQSFDATIGQIGGYKVTLSALYTVPTAVTCPTGAVYQASSPIVMSSADVINDGAVIKVGAFSIDGGEVITHHYTTNGSQFVVSDRKPKMKLTKDSVSTAAEWVALTAHTAVSLTATFGQTAGARMIVTTPVATREGITPGYRADRPTLDIGYGLSETSGDDQFRYQFT